MREPVKLFEVIERKKSTGSIPVDLGDDRGAVTIPPPELWADEVWDLAAAGETKAAVERVLGQDDSDRFHAAGGNYRLLHAIVRGESGADVGESQASSES